METDILPVMVLIRGTIDTLREARRLVGRQVVEQVMTNVMSDKSGLGDLTLRGREVRESGFLKKLRFMSKRE